MYNKHTNVVIKHETNYVFGQQITKYLPEFYLKQLGAIDRLSIRLYGPNSFKGRAVAISSF